MAATLTYCSTGSECSVSVCMSAVDPMNVCVCVLAGVPEVNMKANPSLPLNMSSSMKRPRLHSSPPRPAYHNGLHPQYPGSRGPPAPREHLSEEEEERGESAQDDEDEDEDETEAEDAPRRWSGIEAIFEAYQEYTDGGARLSGVLPSRC